MPAVTNTPGLVGFSRRTINRVRIGTDWLLSKADVQWLEMLASGIALGWSACMARQRTPGLAAGLLHTMGLERPVIGTVAFCVSLPSIVAFLIWITSDEDTLEDGRVFAVYLSRRLGLFSMAWFYATLAFAFGLSVGFLNTGTIAYGGLAITAMGAFYRLRIRRESHSFRG
jgi:hypothetical protein